MNNSIPTTGSRILAALGTRISTTGTRITETKILGIRTQGTKIIDSRTRDSRTLDHKARGSLTNILVPLPGIQSTTLSTIETIDSIVPTTRTRTTRTRTTSSKHRQDVRMSMTEDRIRFRAKIPATSNHRSLQHHPLPSPLSLPQIVSPLPSPLSLPQIVSPFLSPRVLFTDKFQSFDCV